VILEHFATVYILRIGLSGQASAARSISRFPELADTPRSGEIYLKRKQAINIPYLKTGIGACARRLLAVRNIRSKIGLLALGAALALAAFLRFWAAPLSSGVDVPQFWAFARVFQTFGLDFYRYAGATLDVFPTKGWGFVYPPVWLLILGLVILFVPFSLATQGFIDAGWRLAMKTPIIAADLAIGCLLYWAVPGPKWRKLLFACLWLFHPTAWYESGVYGQFDAVAAVLLLAAVILLERGKDRIAFVLAGLAIMTKQHTMIPVAVMLVISAGRMERRRFLSNCAILAGAAAIVSIPFILGGDALAYARSVFFPGQTPGYQNPLVYSFSASGSLLTYLHNVLGWETGGYLRFTIPVLIAAVLAVLALCYRKPITLAQGALAGFLVFLSFSYQVNYQYVIVYIPLTLLVAARTTYRSERVLALILALLPAVWLWLFDVSFWFTFLKPDSPWVCAILARLGLTHLGVPDYAYVLLTVTLICLALVHVVLTFVRWRGLEYSQERKVLRSRAFWGLISKGREYGVRAAQRLSGMAGGGRLEEPDQYGTGYTQDSAEQKSRVITPCSIKNASGQGRTDSSADGVG
jgi:hypothetical protein